MLKDGFNGNIKENGFTLIELLVVVLIMGILAAVALPQYRISVLKSRVAALIPAVAAMKQAAEVYYLEHGEYADTMSAYDVSFPNCENPEASKCSTYDGIWFDIGSNIRFCSTEGGVDDVIGMRDGVMYGKCLTHSENPNITFCAAKQANEMAKKVCQKMGGTEDVTQRGYTFYVL